jgi:DNA-cytosine methyltransferase
MKHGSLFSGIGGIDLGFRWSGIETMWQVEIDSWCRKVLTKNFPEVPTLLEDVKTCGKHNLTKVDIISGGFPCQDISVGGRQRGITTETRSGLWFQFKRIIGELRPTWVFIENVAALRDKGADIVFTDLEELGYSYGSVVVGADILGAPHQRRRVFIVGCKYPVGNLHNRVRTPEMESGRLETRTGNGESAVECESGGLSLSAAQIGALEQNSKDWSDWKYKLGTRNVCASDSTYAECRGTIDGFPRWVDQIGGLGNAVVPAIPMLIGHWIKETNFKEGFDMITAEQENEILAKHKAGETYAKIGMALEIPQHQVGKIVRNSKAVPEGSPEARARIFAEKDPDAAAILIQRGKAEVKTIISIA